MAGESAASRDDLARQAEKHLRQGRTDLALELYERLAQFAPTDWNAVKQLADLLERAGHREAAAGRFLECADHHFAEGFHARAAALYRKVLKLEPSSEHALCQLAEVSLALKLKADARMAFGQVLSLRQRRGDTAGVEAITRRLEDLDAGTPPTAMAAAPAPATAPPPPAPSPEDVTRRLREVAAEADARGDAEGAARAWLAVLHREPGDRLLRNRLVGGALDRQDFDAARPLLDWYGDNDPEGLGWRFEVAQRDGRSDVAQAIAERLVRGRDAEADASASLTVAHAVRDVLRTRHATLADGWCSRIIEALAQDGRPADAVAFIEAATARHPLPIESHLRWVELCVDGGLDGLDRAQYALASAYLHGGQAELARAVADDLVVRQPDVDDIRELVLTIHQACGEPDPERSVQQLLTPSIMEMPAAPMWTAAPETPVEEAWPVDEPSVEPPAMLSPVVVPPPAMPAPALATQAEPVLPAFATFDWGALLGREPDAAPVPSNPPVPIPLPVAAPAPVADVAPGGDAPLYAALPEAALPDEAPIDNAQPEVAPPYVAPPEPMPAGLDTWALPAPTTDAPVDVSVPSSDVSDVDDESWTVVADSAPDPDEVDLTELLEQLQPQQMPAIPQPSAPALVPPPASPLPEAPPALEETDPAPHANGPASGVFEDDVELTVDEPPGMLAAQQVAAGRVFAAAGLAAEAARAFERASRDARSRFEAAEALAGLHRSRGQLAEAIRWYDEAAHAPVPDAADRRPVLYDLAETLEAAGQPDRALAVLLDLLSEVEDYRDARARADRLLRVDAGG